MAVKFPVKIVLTGEDRGLTAKFRGVAGDLSQIGKRTAGIGRSMTTHVSAPIALVGFSMLRTASTFQRSLNTIRAVTNATGKDFEMLKKQAIDLGASTRFTATEVADAMVNLGKAGLSVNEIYASMPGVLALAAATGGGLAEVARISSKALRGFGIAAKDSEKLTNALGIAALGANQTIETLGDSLIQAAPSLDGFGIPMEDTIALVSRFADIGFEGSMGGLALRNVILDLQEAVKTPGGAGFKTLTRLGIDPKTLFDANGQIKNLVSFMDRLRESGANASDIPDIFGRRVVAPMIKMLKPLEEGVSTISAFSESLLVQGETARKAGIMNEGAAGATDRLKAAWERLSVAVGDSGLLQWFTDFVEGLGETLRGMSAWSKTALKWTSIILLAGMSFGPLLMSLGALLQILPVLTKAVWGLNFAFLANPITWVIAGIALLVLAGINLARNWEAVTHRLVQAWEQIVEPFKIVYNFLKDMFLGLVDIVLHPIEAFKSAIRGLSSKLLPGFIQRRLGFDVSGDVGNSGAAVGAANAIQRGTMRSEAAVSVRFDNLPKGVTVVQESNSGVQLDLNLGPAMMN